MNVRESLKAYKTNKSDLKLTLMDIEEREREPAIVQVLTGMPGTHSQSSKVEECIVDRLDDERLKELYRKKKVLEDGIKRVDILLERLNSEERYYMRYYTEGEIKEDLANHFGITYESVEDRIEYIVKKLVKSYEEYQNIA